MKDSILGDLSPQQKEFMSFQQEQEQDLSGFNNTEYYKMLMVTYSLVVQAHDKAVDVNGKQLSEEEIKAIQRAIHLIPLMVDQARQKHVMEILNS